MSLSEAVGSSEGSASADIDYPVTVVRPVEEDDLGVLMDFARLAGPGMTNLPSDEAVLSRKIQDSVAAFGVEENNPMAYFFVMQDLNTEKIVGCSAIHAAGGSFSPFYHFKIAKEIHVSFDLKQEVIHPLLLLVNDYQGVTEMCSLFLSQQARRYYNGSLLSRARFLWMAQYPERFHPLVIAELRGAVTSKGAPPFWEGFVNRFIGVPFAEADRLSGTGKKQFIADLMPKYPIYVNTLPSAVQAVIGEVHPDTKPALELLKQEGFLFRNYIDIFDGGPTIECPLLQIKTIAASLQSPIHIQSQSALPVAQSALYLISNTQRDFRSCIGRLARVEDQLLISDRTADVLDLAEGECIRYVAL
jgi:arginine N-succinyltransferase